MTIIDPNYTDDGTLRDQDRVPLERYLAYGDRAQRSSSGQPFFSGREKEIRLFRSVVNALSMGIQGDATIAVEGPPGAGKTALLSQFEEKLQKLPVAESSGRRWLPVFLDGTQAMSPPEVMESINEAMAIQLSRDFVAADEQGGHGAADIRPRLAKLLGLEPSKEVLSAAKGVLDRGVSAMGFSIGARQGASPRTIQAASRLCARDWSDWQIVLLIDEAQDISAQGHDADPGTLKSIHQGSAGAPLSFCAFGLPGTVAALRDVGVSRRRGGHTLRLSGLEDWEARMAVDRCFDQYAVDNGEAWKSAIVERGAGWPQHLKTYMDAALKVLNRKAAGRNVMGDAGQSSLVEAIGLGDAERMERYQDRIDALNDQGFRFDEYARALVPVFKQADGTPLKSQVTRFLCADLALSDATADGFLRAAERCGFIGPDADGTRYRMPIPSLAGHLTGEPLRPVAEPDTPAENEA